MCVCVYLRSPVRVVYPNHELVVFQPYTGTAPDVGSVANYTFLFYPFRPICLNRFMYLFISLLYPNAPPSVSFDVVSPLYCTLSPPPLPLWSAVHSKGGGFKRHPYMCNLVDGKNIKMVFFLVEGLGYSLLPYLWVQH